MPNQPAIKRLRSFLQTAALSLEERDRIQELLEKAEQGDETALARVKQAYERGYSPIPGRGSALPPGPPMVCPVDPAHYCTFQREVGEELRCPEHNVPLVPGKAGG